MEEKKVTFEEKLTQLLELAKTKKNVLDNKEILNYFHGEILSPEQLDQIYDFLENHHVDVLRMDDDEDMEPELFEDGEEEEPIDVDNLDLSIPDGVSLDDPVRMYLKVQHLCNLVDPSGDHARDRGSGADDPDSGSHGGDDQPSDPDFQTAFTGTWTGTYPGGDRGKDGDAG